MEAKHNRMKQFNNIINNIDYNYIDYRKDISNLIIIFIYLFINYIQLLLSILYIRL